MILTCNSCGKKFVVPDNAITSSGRVVQCGSCGNKWKQYPLNEVKQTQPVFNIKKAVAKTTRIQSKIQKSKKTKKLSPDLQPSSFSKPSPTTLKPLSASKPSPTTLKPVPASKPKPILKSLPVNSDLKSSKQSSPTIKTKLLERAEDMLHLITQSRLTV